MRIAKRHAGTVGFTLIEILVVLLIISIVTSMAMLSFSRNDNKQLEAIANELVQVMTLAKEQAILQSVVLGVTFNDQSLQFNRLQTEAGKRPTWVPLTMTALNQFKIPTDVQVKIAVGAQTTDNDEAKKALPQIIFSINGDVTPFTIYVGKKGQKPRYAITGEADGDVKSTLLSQ